MIDPKPPPFNSNLQLTLTWMNPNVELGLRAKIVACGAHVGCQIGLSFASLGIQPTMRQLSVDGSRGKQYTIDVLGDSSQDQSFTIAVIYYTGTCT